MKIINRDTDYAVKALVWIARNDPGTVSVVSLAAETGIPRPFLRKILQALTREGILTSVRGKGGGFRLALPPDQILLPRVIRTFQGSLKLQDCLFREKVCADARKCPLKARIDKLEGRLLAELAATSIGSLARESAAAAAREGSYGA